MLRREAMQPRESINTRDGHHASIRQVHDPLALRESALLAMGIPEMPRNERVGGAIGRWNGTVGSIAH